MTGLPPRGPRLPHGWAEDTTGLNFGPRLARDRGRAASAAAFPQGFDEAKAKAVTELEQATENVRAL